MASVWKRPDSKYWIACFQSKDGRQLKRSTRTTDRKEAVRMAEEFEQAARKRQTARKARQVITELHKHLTGDDLPTHTARQYFEDWIERKKPETSLATFTFYSHAARKFLAFLGDDADHGLEEITREHLTRFRNVQLKSLAPKTVNHSLKCLKMIFKSARRDSVLSEDPSEFVATVRNVATETEKRAFTIPELQAILSVADDEWRSLVRFGLYTGQRLADLATVTWSNVDLAKDEIRLVTRKTDRRMIIPLSPPLRTHLESLPAPASSDAPLHPRAFDIVERQGKSGSLSNQFADLLAKSGLRAKKSHKRAADGPGRDGRRTGNALSFHSLRRTATTLLHEAGIPAAVAQELIGHDSEEMHQLYVKVGREALQKAAASFPLI